MRLRYLLLVGLMQAAHADDPFSCVDPDVADAFLGNVYSGRGEYSTSVPGDFADLSLPSSMSLVGSAKFETSTSVVYSTMQDPDSALEAAVGTMIEAGWSEDAPRYPGATGGFQVATRPTATALCRQDSHESLSVVASGKAGKSFVTFTRHAKAGLCGSEEPTRQVHDPVSMMRLLPVLRLPDGVDASNSGMGGNGHEVGSHVDITGATGRSSLQSHFENQIRDQGWEYQTSWSSNRSSGSIWALESKEDGLLIGTLHVFDSGAEPIRVRFDVNNADPQKGKDHGSWSGSISGS